LAKRNGFDRYDVCILQRITEYREINLIDQINRSTCSIPSNIAEGLGKRSNLQFAEYLSIALSSAYELETQLMICQRRNYGDHNILSQCIKLVPELQRMIFTYREKILNER